MTWKYMLPGSFSVLFGVIAIGAYYAIPNHDMMPYLFLFCLGMAGLCGLALVINLWRVISIHRRDMIESILVTEANTPVVRIAEALRQMHPEAIKALNRFGVSTTWGVNVDLVTGDRDWILMGTNIHFGFVEFILQNSTRTALYPKRRLAEGSTKWDPYHLVTDRQQYDELETWLYSHFMVTRSHGEYKPAEFIPPWSPEAILEKMGLVGEQDLYRPEDVGRKNLGETAPAQVTPTQAAHPVMDGEVLPPDEQEDLSVTRELEAYAKRYADGKVPS